MYNDEVYVYRQTQDCNILLLINKYFKRCGATLLKRLRNYN